MEMDIYISPKLDNVNFMHIIHIICASETIYYHFLTSETAKIT